MTTFTESIYNKINTISPLSTDDFSIEWLGQSRSYYSSNKARGYEASNGALVKLMNRLNLILFLGKRMIRLNEKQDLKFNNKIKFVCMNTN